MQKALARRSLLVVVGALSVAAAGCGATGGAQAPEQVAAGLAHVGSASAVTKAAETTGAVSSEKVSITVETQGAAGLPDLSVTSEGQVDAKAKTAHLTMDLGGSGEGLTSIETVYDGDTVYLKAPFTSLLGDKPWVKVTSPKLADAVGELGGSVQPDPDALLSLLEGAGTVDKKGTEQVRGVATQHLSVQIEAAKVADQVPADQRGKLDEQLDRFGVSLDDLPVVPADVWIDADGYVRRLQVSFDLAGLADLHPEGAPEAGKDLSGSVTATVELYDFNEPVHIQVPKASEVSELDLSSFGKPGKGN